MLRKGETSIDQFLNSIIFDNVSWVYVGMKSRRSLVLVVVVVGFFVFSPVFWSVWGRQRAESTSVTVAMCASEGHVRAVLTQFRILRSFSPSPTSPSHEQLRLVVCHAAEITRDSVRMLQETHHAIDVINLLALSKGRDALLLRGQLCKPACLMALSEDERVDHILLMDLDLLVVSDPFPVFFSPESPYQRGGLLLFRDRLRQERSLAGMQRAALNVVEKIAAGTSYARQLEPLLPAGVTDYGESAMVFLRRSRQAKMLALLKQILSMHDLWMDSMEGDKELYWLAAFCAYGELPPFSPFGMAPALDFSLQMEDRDRSYVQYVPFGKEPRVLYVNGVKSFIFHGNRRGVNQVYRIGKRCNCHAYNGSKLEVSETSPVPIAMRQAVDRYVEAMKINVPK